MKVRSDQELRTLRLAELRPIVIGGVFVAAFVLGVVGYRDAEPSIDLTTAAFRSVQLFVLEGGVVDGGTPWSLEIARFLAPTAVGYAAIRGAMVLARDQVMVWRTRLFARDHVVVAGGAHAAATIAARLIQSGRSVVALTPAPSIFAGHRERGATILGGDPRDPLILARARPDRAAEVVIAAEVDADALRVLAACEQVTDGPYGPAIHVALNEPQLWEELHSVGLADASTSRNVEFFLAADREARIMLRDATAPALLIEGEGPILERLIVVGARSALLDGRPLELAFGPRAATSREAVLDEALWLSDVVTFHEGSEPPRGRRFDAVIAGIPDAAGIAFGARLARRRPESNVRVAVADGAVEDALARSRLSESNLDLVPARALALGAALLAGSASEILARGKHEDYIAREAARGVSLVENPSMTSWENLPESLKVSNRRYAQSVARKLSAVGATLTPLTSSAAMGDLPLADALLEELAQEEHDRWMADLVADGWQPTDGPKDPDRKLHPLLVPWEDLAESEREKDRDGLRALPRLVARAGYRLTMPDDPHGHG